MHSDLQVVIISFSERATALGSARFSNSSSSSLSDILHHNNRRRSQFTVLKLFLKNYVGQACCCCLHLTADARRFFCFPPKTALPYARILNFVNRLIKIFLKQGIWILGF